MNSENLRFDFSIDRGGTFTDIYCEIYSLDNLIVPIKKLVYKLLSEDKEYGDGPREGIRRILNQYLNTTFTI